MPIYPNPLKSKLPKTGTSIFTVMSKLAQEHNAINLSQGFPDFESSQELIALVNKHMKKGHNQYAPMAGLPALREVISDKVEKLYSTRYNPETEVTITSGATQAIFTAITALVKEGDEVIVFEPAYDCYVPAIELNGGIPVYIQLKTPDFHIDWNEVKKVITQKTRMIIINTPHNPSGAILSARDLQMLEKLTKNTDIIILSDEVYEHIIFDKYEHQSVARYPLLAARSMIVFSFGKTYHNTGWKIGYCLGPESLMAEFRKVHQFLVFSVNTPLQHAFAEFMKNEAHYNELGAFYQEKRDYLIKLLKGSKFKMQPASGSYFQLLNYAKISQEKDTDFAVKLIKEAGIAAIPVSVFYHKPINEGYIRLCFAKSNETLEKAAEKLQGI